MTLKDSLQLVVAETRRREAADLLPLCDDSPRPDGQWTARDNLAHHAAWRTHAARVLRSLPTDADLPPWAEDFDAQNAVIFEANKDFSAAAVLGQVEVSWQALESALESSTDESLRGPRPGRPGHEAWEVVPGNTHGHLAEHLGYWHAQHGDTASAEAAALWAYELDNRAFPDDRSRANASYNLACYYAREARVTSALPHLWRSLQLNPSMREWALKDPDLDPVRRDPEIAALLKGRSTQA